MLLGHVMAFRLLVPHQPPPATTVKITTEVSVNITFGHTCRICFDLDTVTPCRAKCFNMHLYILLCLSTERARLVKANFQGQQGLAYLHRSIPLPLLSWWREELGHQRHCYWSSLPKIFMCQHEKCWIVIRFIENGCSCFRHLSYVDAAVYTVQVNTI